jgi:bifunctional non-homologous end joining protein LigD
MRDATWVVPRLVAEVAFTEWTADGKLRHPSFLGLRPDKAPGECVREVPADSPAVSAAAAPEAAPPEAGDQVATGDPVATRVPVVLTHPDRVLYPRDRLTKQDVAEYYARVAAPLLAVLADRPIALEHWNDGIDAPPWFQQHIGPEAPPWMRLVHTPTRASGRLVRHMIADRPEALRWLAQHAVLTIHMWSSRTGSLESPDWVVFDLDPAEGQGIAAAVEAALVLRGLFERLAMPSVPKTSGQDGLHVFVPLAPGHSHEHAVAFAAYVCAAVARKLPETTVERSVGRRRGRLYLDAYQNGYGKTVVAPYSPRARDGAPVSTPLDWREVTPALDPARFTMRALPARLERVGDLFAAALTEGVRLPEVT